MDKKVAELLRHTMHEGEQKAPVKSIKLKVKFQKSAKSKALKRKKEEEKE